MNSALYDTALSQLNAPSSTVEAYEARDSGCDVSSSTADGPLNGVAGCSVSGANTIDSVNNGGNGTDNGTAAIVGTVGNGTTLVADANGRHDKDATDRENYLATDGHVKYLLFSAIAPTPLLANTGNENSGGYTTSYTATFGGVGGVGGDKSSALTNGHILSFNPQ